MPLNNNNNNNNTFQMIELHWVVDNMIVPVTVFQIFNSIAELGTANLSN